jgi:hypothetical protein
MSWMPVFASYAMPALLLLVLSVLTWVQGGPAGGLLVSRPKGRRDFTVGNSVIRRCQPNGE